MLISNIVVTIYFVTLCRVVHTFAVNVLCDVVICYSYLTATYSAAIVPFDITLCCIFVQKYHRLVHMTL